MAVDTRDKRASVLGLGLAALLVLPEPGTIDQPDRQQVAYSYRGIAATTPAPSVDPAALIVCVHAEDRSIVIEAEDRAVSVAAEDRTIVVSTERVPC